MMMTMKVKLQQQCTRCSRWSGRRLFMMMTMMMVAVVVAVVLHVCIFELSARVACYMSYVLVKYVRAQAKIKKKKICAYVVVNVCVYVCCLSALSL